jgi:hypothetical protein
MNGLLISGKGIKLLESRGSPNTVECLPSDQKHPAICKYRLYIRVHHAGEGDPARLMWKSGLELAAASLALAPKLS